MNGAADDERGGPSSARQGRFAHARLNDHSFQAERQPALHVNRMSLSLDKLINPRSVAIVGVSERPEAIGTRVLNNLRRIGFLARSIR